MVDNHIGRAKGALGEFHNQHPSFEICMASVVGSYMTGCASPDSDVDIRGCYIVPTEDFFRLSKPEEVYHLKVDEYNCEMEMHEIGSFLKLLIQPNMNMMEAVNSPSIFKIEAKTDIQRRLVAIAEDALSKRAFPHIQGMVVHNRKQRHKYNIYDPKKTIYIYKELMRGIVLFEQKKLFSTLTELNFATNYEYQEPLDLLLEKKYKKDYLSESEVNMVVKVEHDLENRMLAAKEFGILPAEPAVNLGKDVDKFILELRKTNYLLNRKV